MQRRRLRTRERASVVPGVPEDPRVAVEHVRAVIVFEDQEDLSDGGLRVREVQDRTQQLVERVRAVRPDIEGREDAETFEAVPRLVDGVLVVLMPGG
jgi:hypothetical protein